MHPATAAITRSSLTLRGPDAWRCTAQWPTASKSCRCSPSPPSRDVLAAAHEISVTRARHGAAPEVSLFDLPLGEHPLWTITEEQTPERGEHVEALLPAWHVSSEHDLQAVPELAFGAAAQSLQQLARLRGLTEAKQSAVARYGRRGFEAAAVTVLAVAASARMPPPPGPHRTAPQPSDSRTRTRS